MRILLTLLILIVPIIGIAVAPNFIDWNKYKVQGLAQVKSMSGYDVTIDGDFKVAFLPSPHVKMSKVKVVNPSVSKDPLAAFEDLSVDVAIAPLFKKQVEVSGVALVKPVFDLRVDREGKGNWLSPEVEAMLAKKEGQSSKASGGQNISFNSVEIEDGVFSFFDAAKNKKTEIQAINVDLSADSLKGPFDGRGSFVFGGQPVVFDVDAQTMKDGALPLGLNVKYGAYDVTIKGVAGTVAPFDIQGETEIKLGAASLPIKEDVLITGILSANQNSAAMKNAAVTIGGSKFAGQALVDMKPMKVQAAFEGADIIDLGRFLPASKGSQKNSDPLVMLTEIVPKTITLPQDFEADVALNTGGLLHNQILLKNTRIKASKKDKLFKLTLNADDIPGTGPASIAADVDFASRSTSKTGAQVYSDPTVNFTVQANTQNTADLVKTLSGKSNLPIVSTSKIGKFYIKGNAKPGRFALEDSVVNLDDLKVLMNGNVKQGDAKPVLDFGVSSSIDDPYTFAKSLNVKTESWPKNLGAVTIGADLKGTMDDLSADAKVNAFGADFTVSGKLDELMSGKATDALNVRVQHSSLKTLLGNVGASAPAFASMAQPIDARATVKMDGKKVNLSGIDAKLAGTTMTGSLGFDGGAAKPSLSGALKFGSLELKSTKGAASGSSSSSGASSSAGKWSTAPMNNGWLHAMNANLDIAADRLIYETWDVSSPSLKINMQDGVLDIQDLRGGMFGGQLVMHSKMSSSSATAPLSVAADASMHDVNIGKLAAALSRSQKLQGDGTVSLDIDVTGNGASQAALIGSLGGSAKLNGTDVVLKGFDLAGLASALLESNKPLPRVQQLVSSSSSSGQTKFDTITGDYTIASGVVSIASMQMDGPAALIASKGSASLPKWYIDTTHTITLKKAESVDPFDVVIKGPLNNPGNTFGKGIFDAYLNEKLGAKIHDLVGDDVGNVLSKFGIIPEAKKQEAPVPANDNTEPAAGDSTEAAQPVQEQPRAKTQEEQAQEAIEGVIKGLFR